MYCPGQAGTKGNDPADRLVCHNGIKGKTLQTDWYVTMESREIVQQTGWHVTVESRKMTQQTGWHVTMESRKMIIEPREMTQQTGV